MGDARVESNAPAFQDAAHSRTGLQTESAAAREHDSVDVLRHMARIQGFEFHRTGSGSAHINPANRVVTAEDYGTSGQGLQVGRVAHQDARNIGQTLHGHACMLASASRQVCAREPAENVLCLTL
jgi:hypothetical protein